MYWGVFFAILSVGDSDLHDNGQSVESLHAAKCYLVAGRAVFPTDIAGFSLSLSLSSPRFFAVSLPNFQRINRLMTMKRWMERARSVILFLSLVPQPYSDANAVYSICIGARVQIVQKYRSGEWARERKRRSRARDTEKA